MSNIEKITIEESKKLVSENEKTHYLSYGFDEKYILIHEGEFFIKTNIDSEMVYYPFFRSLKGVLK